MGLTRALRESGRLRRLRLVGCIVLLLASATGAYILFTDVGGRSARAGRIPQPQIVILTYQPSAAANYNIEYFRGSFPAPGQTTFGPADQSVPRGVRELDLAVTVRPGVHRLHFALMLDDDAAVYNATAPEGFGSVDD